MSFSSVLLGATGLVGSQLLSQLLENPECEKVVVIGRRACGQSHPKLHEHVVDFDAPDSWSDFVRGDVLLLALGTTIKKAGSQKAQYLVDHTYQYRAAQAAAKNGVKTVALISSAGASPKSLVFYSRMKGELERDIKALNFRRTVIVQPGLLAGERSERRFSEELANSIARLLPEWKWLATARPYPAEVVAKATLAAALDPADGLEVVKLGAVFERAGR